MAADPAPLFSPARHRAQRDRLARLPADANFLAPIIAETLLDRLSMVTRTFSRTLLIGAHDPAFADRLRRSEEHTSELQSLMRISYAVFCLKNKTQTLSK